MRKYLFAISALLITVSTAFAEATPRLFSFDTLSVGTVHARAEVVAAKRIKIDIASIAKNPQFFQVPLLNGAQHLVRRTGFERRGPDDFTWRGQFGSSASGIVVLTIHQGVVIGFIQHAGKTYLIENLQGGARR